MVHEEELKIPLQNAVITGDLYTPDERGNLNGIAIVKTGLTLNRFGFAERVAKMLAERGIPTFAYDRRAHNDSTGEFSFKSIEEDLRGILDYFERDRGTRRFGLLGFSFGGITATIAASKDKRIRSLCLINAYPNFFRMELERTRTKRRLRYMTYRIISLLDRIGLLKYIRIRFSDIRVQRLEKGRGMRWNFGPTFHELINGPDATDYIKKLDVPVLFVRSNRDRTTNPKNTDLLFESCGSKQKKLVGIDEESHFFENDMTPMITACAKDLGKHLLHK
jgi:pimeloyl-ACP methyl ester carboxylesterase